MMLLAYMKNWIPILLLKKLKDTYATNDILEAIEEVEQLKNDDNCLRKIYQPLLKNSKSHARQ
ncbi:MAG: hypothetical protein ACLT2Z_04160 [Eubacterium sp.]